MLPGLGPSPARSSPLPTGWARLRGYVLPLLKRRYVRGSLGRRDRATVAVMDVAAWHASRSRKKSFQALGRPPSCRGQRRHDVNVIRRMPERHPPDPELVISPREPRPAHDVRRDLSPLGIRESVLVHVPCVRLSRPPSSGSRPGPWSPPSSPGRSVRRLMACRARRCRRRFSGCRRRRGRGLRRRE